VIGVICPASKLSTVRSIEKPAGNGCTNARESNWYGRAQEELKKTPGLKFNLLFMIIELFKMKHLLSF